MTNFVRPRYKTRRDMLRILEVMKMETEPISFGLKSSPLKTDTILHPISLPNLTRRTLDMLFPPIQTDIIRHRHAVVFGMPECGKTTLMNWLAHQALNRYGDERVNIVARYSIADALESLDNKPVQLLIIDDAVRHANSRRGLAHAEDIADFYEIRHIYDGAAGTKTGIVITVWASQRFMSLDIVFRNAHALIFKTSAVDPSDSNLILKYIGPKAVKELEMITYRIYHDADDEAKSTSVVYLPFARLSGTIRTEMMEYILDFDGKNDIQVSGIKPFNFDVGEVIQKYMNDRNWRKEALAYYLWRIEGRTLKEISKHPKIRRTPGTITQMTKRMRGELARVAGEEYEKWKYHQLEAKGYSVKWYGKPGQPDLVATTTDGKKIVYSCKCLDFDRTVSLDISEVRPEIIAALNQEAQLILAVYNLHDQTEQEIRLDPHSLDKTITIKPKNKCI